MLIGVSRVPEWLHYIRTTESSHDLYLTDGLRLFRVAGTLGLDEGPCVHLEDCYTLTHDLYTPGELWEMELRAVGAVLPVTA
jgi:hypothetical protein